uniref:Uncharacterized protein n=1 Tax=Vitis vinifera TaxID=29760 RepID=A5AWY0_VITVI|nr:hypothetical protein VITISV_018828 [Vitis vinifera]
MVLGGQYMEATGGKETRGQGGMFLEREDEGGERELGRKLRILNEEDGENDQGKTWFYLLVPRFPCHCEFVSKAASTSVLCCSRPASSWQYEMAIEFHRGHGRLQLLPTTQEPNLASFNDDVHAMVKRLLTDDKSFRAVPIMGMEGIGKTTLAKLIFNNKDVLNHFPFGVWTSDGYEFHLRDKEKLMDSNLSQLGDDFDIPARRLMALWVAEDLIQPEGENETPENVAERCLHMLIAQGMVQALRQYWLSKAQQATFLGIHTDTRSELSLGTSRIRHLVDHLDKEDVSFDHIHGDYNTTSTSFPPYYEDVLSFMSFDTRIESKPGEDVGNFLRQSISSGCFLVLLVLDLENVFRPKLPEAIGKLTRLRYFGLRSTFLEILPSSISKLQNVQTLDMKHTSINTLPDSIWKLQQLRHLYLSESYRSKLMLGQGTNFPTILQTLCGLFVDEETSVRDVLDRLLNIRKLGLTMSSKREAMSLQLQAVVDWVLKQKQLRSLRLKSIDQNNQPWDLELKPLVSLVNLSYIYLLGQLNNPSIMSQFPTASSTSPYQLQDL